MAQIFWRINRSAIALLSVVVDIKKYFYHWPERFDHICFNARMTPSKTNPLYPRKATIFMGMLRFNPVIETAPKRKANALQANVISVFTSALSI